MQLVKVTSAMVPFPFHTAPEMFVNSAKSKLKSEDRLRTRRDLLLFCLLAFPVNLTGEVRLPLQFSRPSTARV